MFCKYCGKEIADGSTFCKYCGKKLVTAIQNNTLEDVDIKLQSNENNRIDIDINGIKQEETQHNKKEYKTGIIISIVLFAVIMVLIFVNFLVILLNSKPCIKGQERKSCTYTEKPDISSYEQKKFIYDKNGELILKRSAKRNNMIESKYCDNENTCETYIYKYDSNGNLIEQNNCNGNEENCVSYFFNKYDAKGNKIEELSACNKNVENCQSNHIYKYDSKGNMIEEKFCNENTNTCETSSYQFDLNGNEISSKNCDGNGRNCNYNFYKYDVQSNKIEEKFQCNKNGNNCRFYSFFKYDSKGNQIEAKECDDKIGKYCTIHQYHYDSKGNIIEGKDCAEEEHGCPFFYEYDSHGNRIKEKFGCNKTGTECEMYNFYEYDSKGNVIKQKENCNKEGNICSNNSFYKYN